MEKNKYEEIYTELKAKQICQELLRQCNRFWHHTLAIPLCAESRMILACIDAISKASLKLNTNILVILLVNEAQDTIEEYREDNKLLLKILEARFKQNIITGNSNWKLYTEHQIDWLVIDHTDSWSFARKQGVGLARKTLGDIGIILKSHGVLKTNWMHQTDGDARIPENFFTQIHSIPDLHNFSAVVHTFSHIPADEDLAEDSVSWRALMHYEIWLRYYKLGLAYAGSPYAFFTIGSLISFNLEIYAQARGFPKKNAAEDFYFLNKMNKLAPVYSLKNQAIKLVNRPSNRVPFGTGRGTQDYVQKLTQGEDILTYHPSIFSVLKILLDVIEQSIIEDDLDSFKNRIHESMAVFLKYHEAMHNRKIESESLLDALKIDTFHSSCYEAAKRSRSKEAALKQFHSWFDAFRTLKVIHTLRDEFFGELPMLQSLKAAHFFTPNDTYLLESVLRSLRRIT